MSTITSDLIRYTSMGQLIFSYRVEITQIQSVESGKVSFNLTCRPEYGYNSEPRIFQVATDAYFNNVIATSVAVMQNIATSVSIDDVYIDNPLYIRWGYMSPEASGTHPSVNLSSFEKSFVLTIIINKGIATVIVNRTFSNVGTTGVLQTGAAIYSDDILEISATAQSGYKLNPIITPITVSGNVTVAPTASRMATVQVWDGTQWSPYLIYVWNGSSWDLYQATIWDGTQWNPYY